MTHHVMFATVTALVHCPFALVHEMHIINHQAINFAIICQCMRTLHCCAAEAFNYCLLADPAMIFPFIKVKRFGALRAVQFHPPRLMLLRKIDVTHWNPVLLALWTFIATTIIATNILAFGALNRVVYDILATTANDMLLMRSHVGVSDFWVVF